MDAAPGQPSQPPAKRTALKIVATVVAVSGAVGGLFYVSAVPGMEYYKYVDEVMAQARELRRASASRCTATWSTARS